MTGSFFPPEIVIGPLTDSQRTILDAIRLQCVEDEATLENGTIVRDEQHAILWLLEAIDAAPEPE